MGMVCLMEESMVWMGKTTLINPNGKVRTKITKYGRRGWMEVVWCT